MADSLHITQGSRPYTIQSQQPTNRCRRPVALLLATLLVAACSGSPADRRPAQPEEPTLRDSRVTPVIDSADALNPAKRHFRSTLEMQQTLSPAVQGADFTRQFDQEVVRIRMRDGVELHTEIYYPKGHTTDSAATPLPILFERTPYGLNQTPDGYTTRLRKYPALIADGYIFVFQDTRGRGASGGMYATAPPLKKSDEPHATDDSTDAYDTIDWLVKNAKGSNGRVGTLGISYGGYLVTRALVNPHPALRAASPQATCADMFIGDDWHHNGAFRLDYSFSWMAAMEKGSGTEILGHRDLYEAFMALGPLSNINKKIFHGEAPSWNAFEEHPNLDDFWRYEMCGVLPHIRNTTVPTLNVAGWFDAEDFYGPVEVYKRYEETDGTGINHLVIGPWYHGGWAFARDGRFLAALDFGSNVSAWFRQDIQAPWFARWLKDVSDEVDMPEILAFRTGANVWDSYESWPPKNGIEQRNLYLREDGGLSFEAPKGRTTDSPGKMRDQYRSDPATPVPYRQRPVTHNGWPEWQAEDQRFATGRPDVLSYISEPLADDLTITGEPIAELFAATSGTDSDWVVKLLDVYPEPYAPEPAMSGYQLMVAGEVFRGRYRKSFETPEPLTPEKPELFQINLRSRNHTFKKGHRIMVQIQSSWFPLIDRNPQRYVDNIYRADASDFVVATQSIYRSAKLASHISLPVKRN